MVQIREFGIFGHVGCVPTWGNFENLRNPKILDLYFLGEMYLLPMFAQYGAWAPWLESVSNWLINVHGVDRDFSQRVAILLAYAMAEGLAPRIASGFRDPSHQKALQAQWDAGNRAGLRVRPATNSKHMHEAGRRPAALAVDIPSNNDARLAQIARVLGIGAGADFKDVDHGHYYAKG